jgi:hypothetical protein
MPSSNGPSAASASRPGRASSTTGSAQKGKRHHAALRALGNRWLEVLWHCLDKGIVYDETVHVANRNRPLDEVALAA